MMLFKSYFIDRGKFIASIYILILIAFLSSCRKDIAIESDIKVTCNCIPIPPFAGIGIGYNYIIDSAYYSKPFFNPNNDDEIIFIHQEYGTGVSTLYKYNIITKQKESIYTGNNEILFPPKWGENDWILLNLSDQNIWKIKSNGDSLTQLTYNGGLFHPEWNINSELFIADNTFNILESLIYDENGIIQDTVDIDISSTATWRHSNFLVDHSYNCIKVFDVQNKLIVSEYTYNQSEILWGSIMWIDSLHLIWSNMSGIYSSDLNFNSVNILKESCNSVQYQFGDINKSKSKLIWQVVKKELITESQINIYSNLVMMDIDGTNEQIIQIP